MYEQHFGFKCPPFKPIATGADVFLGPQTARTIKAVRKALAKQDAAVTVSGPVGVGKTTVVGRALDALGGKQTRIRIGRMSIGHDEILDYLLEVLGVTNAPSSTIRRIAVFRAMLMQKKQDGERVIVIVEDGARLGEDPLAELEALTAADGGAGGGAGLVIMGDTKLRSALSKPSLDRLNQRIRLRHVLEPHNDSELTAYLKHCFRQGGVEFDQIFDAAAMATLCQLASGIPRVCNNLVEAALSAAVEQGEETVNSELLTRIADQEFGLTVGSSSADVSQIAEALVPPPDFPSDDGKPEIEVSQTSAFKALSPESIEVESGIGPTTTRNAPPEAESVAMPEVELDDAPAAEAMPQANATVPELPVLNTPLPEADEPAAPETTAEAKPAPAEPAETPAEPAPAAAIAIEPTETPAASTPSLAIEPEPANSPAETTSPAAIEAEPAPALEEEALSLSLEEPVATEAAPARPETAAAPPEEAIPDAPDAPAVPEPPREGPAAPEVPSTALPEPDWDREPTLAELRPDLDAIESAMAEDVVPEKPAVAPAPAEPEPEIALRDPTLPGIPELKLDESIQASIDEARSALEEHDSTVAEGTAEGELAAAAPEPPSEEIQEIARGIARAKTLDDVDDTMAETLFGEEFSEIAAQVAASVANIDTGEHETTIVPDEQAPAEKPAQQKAPPAQPAAAPAAAPPGGDPSSASARLAQVRALNAAGGQPAAAAPASPPTATAAEAAPASNAQPATAGAGGPASIESQFADSMAPAAKAHTSEVGAFSDDDDDDDDKKKGGFFSRFKRS